MDLQLELCCQYLESSKVTERTKAAKQIIQLLEKTFATLNDADWKNVIRSVYQCLWKDAEKYAEDKRKKGVINLPLNGNIFSQTVSLAIKSGASLDYDKIFEYIKNCFENKTMSECYTSTFLTTLKDSVLPFSGAHIAISETRWIELFQLFKNRCLNDVSEKNFDQFKCLALLIKYGPLYSLPANDLRQEFSFITKLCQNLTQHSPRPQQEVLLEIVFEFCKHTATDNRMSCCKLGEDIFSFIISFYELNTREDKIKVLLIEFLLIQVTLHNPKGVLQDHPAAYAYNWNTWNNCLRSVHILLNKEIGINLKCRNKNTSFFITKNNMNFLDNKFVLLYVEVCHQIFDFQEDSFLDITNTSPEPRQKRRKLDTCISDLINNISSSKHWAWLQILYTLLKMYPHLINKADYTVLLLELNKIMSESKDPDFRYHLDICLLTLDDTERYLNFDTAGLNALKKIWISFGESALKMIGLNQNSEQTEMFLQRMICKREILQSQSVFQTFIPTVLKSESRMHSIKSACQNYILDKNLKTVIFKYLLDYNGSKNFNYLSHNVTAEVLVCLILKHWPFEVSLSKQNQLITHPYEDISDIYFKTALEEVLVCSNAPEENIESKKELYNFDNEMEQLLFTLIETLHHEFEENEDCTVENLLNLVFLYKNVLNYLLKFKIVPETCFEDCGVTKLLQQSLVTLFEKLTRTLKNLRELGVRESSQHLEQLCTFLTEDTTSQVLNLIISNIPPEFLTVLFDTMRKVQKTLRFDSSDVSFALRNNSLRLLTTFSLTTDDSEMNQFQKYVFTALLEDVSFDAKTQESYTLMLTFLKCLKLSNSKCFNQDMLLSILKFIQLLCGAKYQIYSCALEIFEVLKDVFKYLDISRFDSCIIQAVGLLNPFYERKSNYGPKITVCLINCMEYLYKMDENNGFSQWIGSTEIVFVLCEQLKSDFQEVRFSAIKSISNFFKFFSSNTSKELYEHQKTLLKYILEMSQDLFTFQVAGDISEERKIDETITRTSSVLQTFTSLILSSDTWIEEALFLLLRIAHIKKLNYIEKAITLISNYLKIDSLDKYLEYILEKWYYYGYTTEEFPFKLFNCGTKNAFCLKYSSVITPIIIKNRELLLDLSTCLNKPMVEIIEESIPKIFVNCLCEQNTPDLNNALEQNNTLTNIIKKVGLNKFKQNILDNIDVVCLYLLKHVLDEEKFTQTFNSNIIFHKNYIHYLNVDRLLLCFETINLHIKENFLVHLMTKQPKILIDIILKIKLLIENSNTLVEKLKTFHHYFLFSKYILENIEQQQNFQEYYLKDFTYYLLHLMNEYIKEPNLSNMACKTFRIYFKLILPKYAICIKDFFHIVVSNLKKLSTECKSMDTECCTDILEILIIENSEQFINEIEILDPFPDNEQFGKINSVHKQLKYHDKDNSLKKEIKHFLNCGYKTVNCDSREEGLKHLRIDLSDKKDELRDLYLELYSTRGFSEDCEKSLLHQLICMLINLSASSQQNVSIEAVRNLGELGASDLSTLVMKPEVQKIDIKWTPIELITGCTISLLMQYVVDSDLKLVEVATKTLDRVLDTYEGKKIAESGEDFGFGAVKNEFLFPFISHTKVKPAPLNCINENLFIENLIDDEIWCPSSETSHENWIILLTCNILQTFTDKSYLPKLIPVCKLKAQFCEKILSLLFYKILSSANEQCVTILSMKIGYFFLQHWNATIKTKNVNTNLIATNKTSIKCMLDSVHFIRLHQDLLESKKHTRKLDLNYLHVAQAAQFCSAHFSAILYAELWCQTEFEKLMLRKNVPIRDEYTILDIIYDNINRETAQALENILRKGYNNIGDLDALHGCGTSLVLNPHLSIQRYKEMNKWDQVLLLSDAELNRSKSHNSNATLIKAMTKCNLFESALLCQSQDYTTEDQYECLWRLSQWDIIEKKNDNHNEKLTDCFEKFRYFALKSFHENDQFRCENMLKSARLYETEKLKHTSLESSKNIYNILTRLQCLQELEEFADARNNNTINELLLKWKNKDVINKNEFQYIETIKAQRIVLLTDLIKQQPQYLNALTAMTLSFAEIAREENNYHVATRTLTTLQNLPDVSNDTKALVQLQNAQLCWATNDKIAAKLILRYLCQDKTIDSRIQSSALKLSGDWMTESFSENKDAIINDYYLKSLKVLSSDRASQDEQNVLDTYDKLATFAYKQYQQVSTHINSEGFQRKKNNRMRSLKIIQEIKALKINRKLTKDELRSLTIHVQQSSIDQKEIEHTEEEKNKFLKLCLKYYLLNLKHTDKNNIRIFRIMSIFLENRNNEVIFEYINKYLPHLPSYKYITILPQIIPHISNKSDIDLYTKMCNIIIKKCACDHPHHTLPLLLALNFATEDSKYSAESKNAMPETIARMSCAQEMLQSLKKNKKLTRIINRMELLSEALIQLAYETKATSTSDKDKCIIPRKMKIMNIKDFNDVLLPTYTLSVNKDCEYNDIIGINSFRKEFYNVGGINAPKRIYCIGTDGKARPQLIKGQDDLRQDAVMQQVFTIMNSLLATNKHTKNLVIRTYKVVPLSMRSGVLEWVENSMPIGEYLVAAHDKYRPQDKSAKECRNIFKNMAKLSADIKLQKFNELCKVFKPVFNKFFETSFLQPAIWYERRRAYINSVATTSMCGYILGIGDRHVQNILIDKSTAELIHIDFGIAFEQGLILPTPETIPFRLTRDIVDGMGASGIEGIFRRSCEKTMEVMRHNSETIITILEVLLYDPLYSWTVTSAEANKRQTVKDEFDETDGEESYDSSSSETIVNITAERALLRLRGKLLGIEEGSPTSIEHQVSTLIQNAKDPANLCRVFNGWQPYL